MARCHLAICCFLAACLGLTACGDGPEPAGKVPATALKEQVQELDRTTGERLREGAENPLLVVPELIGVPLPTALARLERIEDNAKGAFERGLLDRRVNFDVHTEVVGFASSDGELVVSGYVVDAEPGAKLIADGAQITLYAVPSSRFEEESARDSFRARPL